MDFPFSEKKVGGKLFLREFKEDVASEELVWHQDREDRRVKVVESDGWMLQIDNELPVELCEGDVHNIPAHKFHRVIKGSGPLKIIVEKKMKPLNTLLEEIESGKEFFVLGYLSNAYRYGPQREYFWAGPFASRKEAQALADRKQKYGPAKKFKDWMAGFSRIIMGRERFLRAAEKAGIQPRMDMIEGASLDEAKKGDTVSYSKKGKKVKGKVVVPDARGPLVGVDPEDPDEMDMVPEDKLGEADKHPPTYKPGKKSIRGMTRGEALEKSKEDIKKAKELRKKGQAGKAKELEQRAYRRRESMEKAERGKRSYKHKKSRYSEAHLHGLLDEILAEKKYSASVEKSLKNKAEKHNAPLGALRAVYSKGLGAYSSSGSRPGQTPQAWAMARVNSFLKGGKARKVDAAQWKQVQKHRKKKK